MLTPAEILDKEFKTIFRGYDPQFVKQFLNSVAQEMQKLLDENNHLKKIAQKQEDLLNEFRTKEDTLNNALLSSQKYIDQMKQEAEENAQEIILAAQTEGRKKVEKEMLETERLHKQQENLRQENNQFIQRIRFILKEHEELISKFEEENVAARARK
ncbi:DivIVA domain-containing protein [candidate division CSSED10-310 bacterium]|uniref:DivIVA domain-containing protein n=1 Tax=candidate division CSSED10-310 bacterium TaxID=2855610 RepID=A0ABV6Z5R3_UNCC1